MAKQLILPVVCHITIRHQSNVTILTGSLPARVYLVSWRQSGVHALF